MPLAITHPGTEDRANLVRKAHGAERPIGRSIYWRRKRTGTLTWPLVGTPAIVAGRKVHFFTARIAAESSKPLPELLTKETNPGRPLLCTSTCNNTVPSVPERRAAAG